MPEPTLTVEQKKELAYNIAALLPPDVVFFVGVVDQSGEKDISVLANIEPDALAQIFVGLGQSAIDEPIVDRDSYSTFAPN